jgi:hypothetical protein
LEGDFKKKCNKQSMASVEFAFFSPASRVFVFLRPFPFPNAPSREEERAVVASGASCFFYRPHERGGTPPWWYWWRDGFAPREGRTGDRQALFGK